MIGATHYRVALYHGINTLIRSYVLTFKYL
jgi:hypothetical protein